MSKGRDTKTDTKAMVGRIVLLPRGIKTKSRREWGSRIAAQGRFCIRWPLLGITAEVDAGSYFVNRAVGERKFIACDHALQILWEDESRRLSLDINTVPSHTCDKDIKKAGKQRKHQNSLLASNFDRWHLCPTSHLRFRQQ